MNRVVAVARKLLPHGHLLSAQSWRMRHRALTTLLWIHIPALGLFGAFGHRSVLHLVLELVPVTAFAFCAGWTSFSRRVRSISCAVGLMSCSALLVHLSGGYIEMHFHFFVMIGLLTLYQDWTVFLGAILYVAVHHAVVGVLDPRSVYNHPDAWAHPWKWAAIHASFVLAASAAGIANWKLTERAQEDLRRNVSELTENEAALRRGEEHTRRIIETAHDAFVAIDAAGTIIDWNGGAENLFGWPSQDALGRKLQETIIPERYRDAHRRGFERFLATGEGPVLGNRIELSALRRSGGEFPIELTIWAVKDGTSYTFNAFLRDISERNRARDAIERARQEAETANRAKSAFLSRMSHELRTPLNAILGFGQLLQMDGLSGEQGDNVHQILRAGRHLLELINEVLDIARIEEGQLSLSIEAVDLQELTTECVDLVRSMALQHSVRLDAGGIPAQQFVLADRQRLKQVLLNLLTNAIKYNNDGGSVRISSEMTTATNLRIRVIDTGPGIAAALMDRLFVPFDRLGAEQGDVEGTGIGLALSKRLVDVMGGTIGADSVAGEGSTFWVELQATLPPVVDGNDHPADVAAALDRGPSTEARVVLYIEDNPSNLRLVERVLSKRHGIRLLTAMHGGLGLDLAREHHPDMILLDLNLPDISGEEVMRRLRDEPETAAIPIVVLSADATSGGVERLLEAGARAYITKPIDLELLLDVIDETLQATVG